MSLAELNFWYQQGNTYLQVLVKSDFLPFQAPAWFWHTLALWLQASSITWSNLPWLQPCLHHLLMKTLLILNLPRKFLGSFLHCTLNLIIYARSLFLHCLVTFSQILRYWDMGFLGGYYYAFGWGILNNFCGTFSLFPKSENLCFQLGDSAWRAIFFFKWTSLVPGLNKWGKNPA